MGALSKYTLEEVAQELAFLTDKILIDMSMDTGETQGDMEDLGKLSLLFMCFSEQ